jgi:hypothetical protein
MMSRYKGRTKPTLIERDFPHHVEVIVRWAGSALVSMPCTTGSVQKAMRRRRRDENGRDYIRWCFAERGMSIRTSGTPSGSSAA